MSLRGVADHLLNQKKAYLGEIHQHLSHLVTALTAADVDDDITVRELGHTLGNDSLATSKGTGNAHRSTLDTGEESIQHSLTDNEGLIRRLPVADGTGHTDGPGLHHTELGLLALELDLQQLLLHGIATGGGDAGDGTAGTRGEKDLVVVHQAVLKHGTPNVTSRNVVANLEVDWREIPLLLTVERIDANTAGDVDTLGLVGDSTEGSLDTVVDRLHQTGAQLDGQGLASARNRIADSQTICVSHQKRNN